MGERIPAAVRGGANSSLCFCAILILDILLFSLCIEAELFAVLTLDTHNAYVAWKPGVVGRAVGHPWFLAGFWISEVWPARGLKTCRRTLWGSRGPSPGYELCEFTQSDPTVVAPLWGMISHSLLCLFLILLVALVTWVAVAVGWRIFAWN